MLVDLLLVVVKEWYYNFLGSNTQDTIHRQVKMDDDFSHNDGEIFNIDQARNRFLVIASF